LRQWTRSILNEWDGITVVFDRIRMDVTDINDINKRYGTNHSTYNRATTKVTRMTAVPTLTNGWYSYSELGKQGYYKTLNPVAMTETIIDVTTDEPWASAPNASIYSYNKVAHLQESFTDNSSTKDDITFLGVHARGDLGRQAPITFGPFTSANGAITGCGIVDGTQTYVILFNRDPDTALIETTETITLTGMNLLAGTKIRALGWSNSVSF